ncbi:DUF885 domain-containing protein [Congregibacter litoralis]|uniref:DUF885 domain-containing protein n=1 Tax=Congregibacter litoralis KT71 TaxID=314285 RepID=A4ABG3_9GAMM|nr:DUF885 family protein [Congregibacter litoralis]EAQ96717.1 hypothetical protein KT71_06829 [Congregibacter litoralis KT71]
MKIIAVSFLLMALTACGASTGQQSVSRGDASLSALYEREWEWRQKEFGKERDAEGNWVKTSGLPDVSDAAQQRRLAYWEGVLGELDEISIEDLSPEEAINAAVFRQIIETLANDARYKTYEAPLNSDSFFWSGLHPQNGGFEDAASYRRYLGRLRDLPRFFAQHMSNMRAGMARGYTVPAVSLRGRDQSIEAYLLPGSENPFWIPLDSFPPMMGGEQVARLQTEAREVIATQVVPAYTALLKFMREEYLPNARRTLAARDLPDGEAFYQSQIKGFTTLDLTAEEIHNKGLSEVARIRGEMELILAELEYDGDMAAFFHFLRTDPQFYAGTPDELMGVSAYVAKRMDGKLSEVLGFLPRRRFAINPVPPAIAPIYTGGRGGLNACLMNTYNLPARPLYTLPALTLHECAPGHALQAAISLEAPGEIPEFRAQNYFSGYGEGWGLYTEWLGGEIGIYRTPYERFGQLTYEMWRACRLVIDTGLHQYGWSREQAIAYLRDNAAMSDHEITTEIDRYISWPAQALAYKLGEMLIREKRARAEVVLGTDFDQRYFHDRILGLRSVPLSVLASELDAWIDAGGPNPYPDMN